jgi:hypothetical protein
MSHPTERFSARVEHYVRFRPDYPAEVLSILRDEARRAARAVVGGVCGGNGV